MLLQHPLKTLSKDCVTRMLICRYENRLFHRPQFVPRCVIPFSLSPTNLPSRRDNASSPSNELDKEKNQRETERKKFQHRASILLLFFFFFIILLVGFEHLFVDSTCIPYYYARTSCRGFSSRSFLSSRFVAKILQRIYRWANVTVTRYVNVNPRFPAPGMHANITTCPHIWDEHEARSTERCRRPALEITRIEEGK